MTAAPEPAPSVRERRLPRPEQDPAEGSRSVVFPHLASGRVILALVAPQAVIWALCWWWITPQLVESGAILRNGYPAWMASASVPLAPVVTGGVLAWLVGTWSLGVALVLVAEEAQGRVPRWRDACGWPRRHPWAVPAIAGLSIPTLLVYLTAAALWWFVLPSTGMPRPVGHVMLAMLLGSVDLALVPLHRRAYGLIVLGTRRWPGVVDVVPPVPGTSRSAGWVAWWTVAFTTGLSLIALSLLNEALGAPAWVGPAVVVLIVGLGVSARTVGIANDLLPDALPVLGRPRGSWRPGGRWVTAVALLAVPAVTLVLTPRIDAWDVLSYRDIPVEAEVREMELETGGDTTLAIETDPESRTLVQCGPDECDPVPDTIRYADRTVGGDGTTWEVAWDGLDTSEGFDAWMEDPEGTMTLTLTSSAGESLDLLTTTDSELRGVQEEYMAPRDLLFDSPLAIAERDGVVAVLALGAPGPAGPLHMFVCAAGECTAASTVVSRYDSVRWSGVALEIAPDGTVSAAINSTAPLAEDSGVLFVHLDHAGALSTELILDPVPEHSWMPDHGISLAFGPDGTAWVLYPPDLPATALLIRCDDPTCTTREVTWHKGVEQGLTALVVDSSNRPMIATAWEAHGAVRLLSCPDRACASLTEVRLWDTLESHTGSDDDAVYVTIGLDDDRPVIVVADPFEHMGGSRVIRCDEPRCGAD